MRAAMKIGIVLLSVAVAGGLLFADDEEKPKKKKRTKPTKEEKKALAAKGRLAMRGSKLYQQSSNFSGTGKSCGSCHKQGSDKDLRGKVTEDNTAEARTAITKCLENRMKMNENEFKKKQWAKNPQNMDALIAYLQRLRAPRRR